MRVGAARRFFHSVENPGRFFHTMEKSFGIFPHNGKNVSMAWKKIRPAPERAWAEGSALGAGGDQIRIERQKHLVERGGVFPEFAFRAD
jgi:hypothetical protein